MSARSIVIGSVSGQEKVAKSRVMCLFKKA